MLQSREFFNGSLRPLIFVQNIHFIVKTTQYLCKLFYHVAFYGGWLTWPFANWGFFQAFTRFLGWGPEKRNVLKSIGLFPDRFRAATGGRAGGSWRSACRWRCWSTGQTRILTAALVLTQKFIIQFILEFHQICLHVKEKSNVHTKQEFELINKIDENCRSTLFFISLIIHTVWLVLNYDLLEDRS